jgi:hypothetical protein
MRLTRRQFLQTTSAAAGASLVPAGNWFAAADPTQARRVTAADLPKGSAPAPVPLPHFPSRLHAFVWRNWQLAPVKRLAAVVGARPADIVKLGKAMGLPDPPRITPDLERRSALTVIRRNWHLLPYEQLLALLGWTPAQMAFSLREDDFLYAKLGSLKPQCEPLRYAPSDERTQEREREIARLAREAFPQGVAQMREPLFGFVSRLSTPPTSHASRLTDHRSRITSPASRLSPRFCYSYFALYGDPLLEPAADPFPDGYLARLAGVGVDGVWLQAVLYKLALFPWEPGLSTRFEERLANLRALVARARKHGLGVYLYLNEPRARPLSFYEARPQLKGVVEGDHAALCTTVPEVREYLREAVASICRAVPDLGGFFTITGSENLTNCWSHGNGAGCARCGKRGAAEVIAELNAIFSEGIRKAGTAARLIAWDWGWHDDWAEGIISRLPADVALMSVSEWSIPLKRGGVETTVGEYSISVIGPGPRAKRHWELARRRGLKTIAKIQAGNTWELSAVPYIPAVENVARHAANLREAHLDGLMLGWTLGGYPSPNLEVVAEMTDSLTPEEAMRRVAERRYGSVAAPAVVQAWRQCSTAFGEFPYHSGLLYNAPMQFGPSNLLWGEPTGYHATMVGFPYDDLDGWRQVYPAETFIAQFSLVAEGFRPALNTLARALQQHESRSRPSERVALLEEHQVMEAAFIHFLTTANQARFVQTRRALANANNSAEARPLLATLESVLQSEIRLAQRLHELQTRDSRLGFEASNQYYYVPLDLVEKVLNCRDLLGRWLPAQRAKWGLQGG